MSLTLDQLSAAQLNAVRRVVQWGVVRPEELDAPELEESGWLSRCHTVLGHGVILTRLGCRALGLSERGERSGTTLTTALYLQDARAALAEQQLTDLQPGLAPYFTVLNIRRRACPLLGRLTLRGYQQRTVARHLTDLDADLLARGVTLIVVHPEPGTLRLTHDRLKLIHVPPRWG